MSSANHNLHNMIKDSKKKHIILLNKADLASKNEVNKWIDKFNESKIAIPLSLINEKKHKSWSDQQRVQFNRLLTLIHENDQKTHQIKKRFTMVVGFPNVGKSTLINQLIGKKKTSVASKPAWTRNLSFYQIEFKGNKSKNKTIGQRLSESINADPIKPSECWVVDTPGIMLPEKLEPERGLKLALCQILDDNIVPDSYITMAEYLHYNLCQKEDDTWKKRIGYEGEESFENLLDHIKKKYGKNTEDEQSRFFVAMFRKGGLGEYNLDNFEDNKERGN